MVLGNNALNLGALGWADAAYSAALPVVRTASPALGVVLLFQAILVALELPDPVRVRDMAAECERLADGSQAGYTVSLAKAAVAVVRARTEATANGVEMLIHALDSLRTNAPPTALVLLLTEVGHLLASKGRGRAALNVFLEATELALQTGQRLRLARALEGVARSAADHRPEIALQLVAFSARVRKASGACPLPSDTSRLTVWLRDTQHRVGKVAANTERQRGQLLTMEQAMVLARSAGESIEGEVVGPTVLTVRERQVAALLARGSSNKTIATELGISPATVGVHVEHILDKLDFHSRAQVAAWTVQTGLAYEVIES
jgi:DNA-binding CsgD family transcriptional regulator